VQSATPRARATSAEPETASWNRRAWTIGSSGWVVLLTALGAVLRVYRLGANSLWIDEFATFKIVSRPFSEILSTTAQVNFCPPLYFWLVHGIVSNFGVSESSLRLLSAAAGTLTIPVAWLLARELTGRPMVAGICAALLAVNPLHIWYSQEARPYALLVWLGSSSLLLLVLAARTEDVRYWVGFVGCMIAVLLTHTIAPLLLAVAWSWALLWHARRAVLRPLLAATAVITLVAAPFAMVVLNAVTKANGNAHSPPRPLTGLELPYTLLSYVGGYSFGPSMREIQNLGTRAAVGRHPLETALGVITLISLLLLVVAHRSRGDKYFLTLFVIPVVAMLLASAGSGKAYQARYALAGLVGFCGLVAGALGHLPPRARTAATAALLALMAWADGQWYGAPIYWKDDSREAVSWLARHLSPGSSVAVAPGYATGVLAHYAELESANLRFIEAEDSAVSAKPAALLLTRLHHVPNHASISVSFRRGLGAPMREDTVGGYQILSADRHPATRSGE
jgi:4-amino-4-deoxy-L-arabinose transferase-like glycosyltransferase